MARKRAPGAGRKPRGHYVNLRSVLSARITSDLRKKLDGAAREKKHSLAQEVQHRLNESFKKDDPNEWRPDPQTEAFCYTVGLLARWSRLNSKRIWHTDPFAHEVFKLAICKWLNRLTPPDNPELEKPPLTPEEVATRVELLLWTLATSVRQGDIIARIGNLLPKVRRDLGLPFDDSLANFFNSKDWRYGKKE
jgi:hypothetical protein